MYFRDFIVSVRAETPTRAHVSIIREVGAPLTDIIEQPPEFAHLWNQWEQLFHVQTNGRNKNPKKEDPEAYKAFRSSETWKTKRALQQDLYRVFFPEAFERYFDSFMARDGGARIILEAADSQTERDHWFFNTPWELMQRPGDSLPLCLAANVSFVRRSKSRVMQAHDTPLQMPKPLRILVVTANCSDSRDATIRPEQFSAPITDIFSSNAAVEVQSVDSPNLQELGAKLDQFKPHMLHITGHGCRPGDLDRRSGTGLYHQLGVLEMDRSDRGGSPAIGFREFLSTLKRSRTYLRLVTLASCNLARSGQGQWQQGFAAGLCDGGVPAVIAFQFALSFGAAENWSSAFYQSVANGKRIDEALNSARNKTYATLSEGHWSDVEFGSAVLFSGLPDGRLFRRSQQVLIRCRDEEAIGLLDRDVDVLDCTAYFEGNGVKLPTLNEGADWMQDVYPLLTQLKRSLTAKLPIAFRGTCHQSFGIALGYIFNKTVGYQLSYEQRNAVTESSETWCSWATPKPLAMKRTYEEGERNSAHLLVGVSISNKTIEVAKEYFKEKNLKYRGALHLMSEKGIGNDAVKNGEEALFLAKAVGAEIKKASQQNGIRHVHLFISAPTGFALFLGMQLNACRQLQMYEFSQSGYVPSFLLAN